MLFIDANSFDHYELLLYVVSNEEQIHYFIGHGKFASIFITTGYEDIAVVGMTIPGEIIDKIFQYERYILMKEHF